MLPCFDGVCCLSVRVANRLQIITADYWFPHPRHDLGALFCAVISPPVIVTTIILRLALKSQLLNLRLKGINLGVVASGGFSFPMQRGFDFCFKGLDAVCGFKAFTVVRRHGVAQPLHQRLCFISHFK